MPYILVALNKADMVDDEELIELVEMEVRNCWPPRTSMRMLRSSRSPLSRPSRVMKWVKVLKS